MKEELYLYGNEYSLFDTFYNGAPSTTSPILLATH
jgi:hypothetical protein